MGFKESPTAWRGPFDKASARLATSTRQTDLLLPTTPPPVEEEIPISQLPLAGPLFGDEQVAIVQYGITCRATAAAVGGSGQAPVYINKVISLVYPVVTGQTVFSLSTADHYGNGYRLSDQNALQVTIGGIRYIEDDGSATWGQYTVDLNANTITLVTPFGTDPVVIVGDGDVAVFDIFNINSQNLGGVNSNINAQPLTIVTRNVLPPLEQAANGVMTTVYVNGRAFSDVSIPPSFFTEGHTLLWADPLYSVNPGDEVVAVYTYDGPSGAVTTGGGGGGGPTPGQGLVTEAVAVLATNSFAPLTNVADGATFILTIDGTSFVAVGAGAVFAYSGRNITWLSTIYTISPGANVAATYSFASGASSSTTEAVNVLGVNSLAPLAHVADGGAFILTVDGTSFVAVGGGAAFSYSGHNITWLSTTYTIGTGANVAATYSYVSGT